MKQNLGEFQEEINKSTVIVRDFNTPFSKTDRLYRQKIKKVIENLNNTINQFELIDIFLPTITEYIFSSSAHRTFTKLDHILAIN